MASAGNQTIEAYRALYKRSVTDPEGFWSDMAGHLDWYKKWDKVLEYDFKKPEINWFKGGKLNVSDNCLDRHLHTWRSNKAALIWQGMTPDENRVFTYQQLHYHVCKFANVLKKFGVRKGDRVSLYLPNIPELLISMLACARIGAIHSAVFIGFGQKILADRINDSGSKLLITADGCYREGQLIQSKAVADEALKDCPGLERVIIVKRLEMDTPFTKERDLWWHEEMGKEDIIPHCEPAVMDAEDALFLLYTGGSKGHPNGIIHATAGYLLFSYQTLEWSFHLKDEDVFFSTEDPSGIIGHSYGVYGPLALGATTLMLEDSPGDQNPACIWEMVEKYKVTALFTDPAAARALMRGGEEWGKRREISGLRLLGTAGEPHREAWNGRHLKVGLERCRMLETWSQPETGGFLIHSLPIDPLKTESVLLPFPGIVPKVLTENGSECDVDEVGSFVMANPWPAMLRGFWNDPDHSRFKESHFKSFPGYYFTGEGAKKDSDGYFRMMGRIDEAIQIAGNRIEMAEIENALASHPSVAERAAIHVPHHERGSKTYAFVTLKTGVQNSETLREELLAHTKKLMGPAAAPDQIHLVEVLPKTKNRTIMRRMLGKIAEENIEELGTILLFHPGHTWLKLEKSDEVRIGIDSFLGRIIGGLKMIVLPQSGRRFDQGDALCLMIRKEGSLNVVFPVGGSILSVNEKLKENPELVTKDPLGEGYLVTVRPTNFQRDRKHLYFGEAAVSWFQREWERFKAAVVSELRVDQRALGVTMQDGEIEIGNIEKWIDTERYIQLLNAFLREGGKEPSEDKY